ncbi:MAG: MG2 domain-containing protein [Maribacter sp.]
MPYTLAEVDIQRLQFIYGNAVFEHKEERYTEVLRNAASAGNGNLASSLYAYEQAAFLNMQGSAYEAKNGSEHRWEKKEALLLCEKISTENPESRGAEKCKVLRLQILAKNVQLTAEKNIPTDKISRLLVNYTNYDSLQLTAYRITERQWEAFEELYEKDKELAFIKKLPSSTSWEASLKNEKDYQPHSTEIAMPALGNGSYIILAEPRETGDKTFAYAKIQVTNLALVETQTETHHDFQVVDRNTGAPIAGAQLTFSYSLDYGNKRSITNFTSDQTGTVSIKRGKKEWSDTQITIHHEKETALYEDYYMYRGYEGSDPGTSYTCFLFTDRSIYRPGQPLYFKGIAVKAAKETSTLLQNATVSVTLMDVNGQMVQTETYNTNEFGSFSGEFILPNNGLTGEFTMQANSDGHTLSGYTRFSVEEYKRPKFETSFKPVTETYKVNDSITVQGIATAYSGSAITDAKVTYRVKRVVNYPRWYYWRNGYLNSAPQEITHGETVTDGSGNYSIPFKALPEQDADKKNVPTFNYEVIADVTDVNGETHSASTTVAVGYHALTANMMLANPLDKDTKDQKLTVVTRNLNGQPVAAKGTVKMYKLVAPSYVVRPRVWAAPDYAGFSKETFKELYPHDAYKNEHDSATWEKGELVWQSNFDTGTSTEIALGSLANWPSGTYVLELETKDRFGQEVKDVLQAKVLSEKDKKLADNQLFHIKTDKANYAIGDKVKVTLLSNAKDLSVTVYIEKNKGVVETKIVKLNENAQSFTVPVKSEDLGGFAISYSYSVFNYFQSGNLTVQVPYPATDLQIETVTFRDKLQPGTGETWSFKIKGAQGEKVAAELLASMYDASLDAFRGHSWSFNPLLRPYYYSNRRINAYRCFTTTAFSTYQDNPSYSHTTDPRFDSFDWFGFYFGNNSRSYEGRPMMMKRSAAAPANASIDMMEMEDVAGASMAGAPMENDMAFANEPPSGGRPEEKQNEPLNQNVQIRTNLQETAFFFPQLQTDKDGAVSFNFTTPEALTKWNLQVLAHSKSLESSYRTLQTVTQKELMVVPNAPRFLRDGDEIVISSKIANLTKNPLSGQATVSLTDAFSGRDITTELLISMFPGKNAANGPGEASKTFNVDAMGNTQVSWRLKIPSNVQAVQYTVLAKAGAFSDGEQNVLPVLTNRMLVTETLPMWVGSNKTKTFTLDKLKNTPVTPLGSNKVSSLKHHKLTLEITSNPAWYAVQALPYLMEYPYECNEQTFSKYYANSLASHIVGSDPRIRQVFDQWANADALLSNLEKNEELKSILIQETPWLRDAQSETEQKKRIALLFDLNKMKSEQATALRKLEQHQQSSGAWPWFNGGPDSRFVTQHIVAGLGHLNKLTSATLSDRDASMSETEMPVDNQSRNGIVKNALSYLDNQFVEEYEEMKKRSSNIDDDHLSQMQIHYMYMRSFFKGMKTSKKVDDIQDYYLEQAKKYWKDRSLYSKGMLALVLQRNNDTVTAEKILLSLNENSITSEALGMYWKSNTNSWHWYQAPIETQALLIEVFSEIHENDIETVDNLKIWLLKNKQTNQWPTTKATTEAVYALLLQGSDWLSVTDAVEVRVGGEKIESSKLEAVHAEAGTGYYKTSWNGTEIKPGMAEVALSKKGNGIAWGALYWQYFEDLDKITSAETPLQLNKKLFLKKNTDTGEIMSEITPKTGLKVGDLVRIRIELRADRPMEFVHMKDMRAAGFEPINVISSYKWQDGLGYYEATKDASTNFFFDYVPKGVFVFEYDVRVNNAGNFSNGITTIQSMYAPEFSSHSEGVRVSVEQK